VGARRGAVLQSGLLACSGLKAKNNRKPKALCVTAERLEGSPPPELPKYVCDCAAKEKRCKYVFRNQKVISGNQT
jgi:hypothetical protein